MNERHYFDLKSIGSFQRLTRIAGLVLVIIIAGCGREKPPAAPPPPVVSVMQPVQREIIEWDEYIGRLESPETVEIRARVSGYLDKVHFKEGKEVKKGDLLFTIDPRPYQAEFDRADGDYQRALNQAELAKNEAERGGEARRSKGHFRGGAGHQDEELQRGAGGGESGERHG